MTSSILTRFRRTSAGLAAATLLVVATAGPAAADHRDYRAEADGVGLSLEVFPSANDMDLVGAGSRALTVDGGAAAARGIGLNQVEDSISEVDLESGSARDPESGDNCATPDLPDPLPDLPVDFACSNATATAGDAASALARGFLGEVDVDGALLTDLVDLIVDEVAVMVTQALDDALEPLEEQGGPALEPVLGPLADACFEGLGTLQQTALAPLFDAIDDGLDMDPSGELGPAAQALVDALEALAVALPEACNAFIQLTQLEITPIVENIADALRDALEDLDLLRITLGGTTSSVETIDGTLMATSMATGAEVVVPALGEVVDAIESLVPGLISAITDQISEEIGDAFADLVPAVEELLQPVLDGLMLPDLLEGEDPLLTLTAGVGVARAALDIESLDVTTSGESNTVIIQLSETFATLLGEENTRIEIPGGTTMTIAEDTPLESTISLLGVEEITRASADESYDLSGTRAGGVTLALLQSEEAMGGITLELAAAEAVVGGVEIDTPAPGPDPSTPPAPAPTPQPTLPTTGGGLALLGLIAAGGALALGRRRG